MLNACVRSRSDHTPCGLLLYLRCYLALRDISSSKQEVAEHVIRQNCRPKKSKMTLAINDLDDIAGMTVNERLYHFGLIEAFDTAVESRKLSSIVGVLRQAKLTEAQALETASSVLANPSFYGLR